MDQDKTRQVELSEVAVEEELMEESNIQVVNPNELGFVANDDIITHPADSPRKQELTENENNQEETAGRFSGKKHVRFSFPKIRGLSIPKFNIFGTAGSKMAISKFWIIVPVALVLLALLLGSLYWFVPHAIVTIYVVPKSISEKQAITIDPNATAVDSDSKIVPGKQLEKSLTAEKTIPVTGRKKVGDPARGTVTIYNKTTSLRSFKKGTILTSGSLQFTLDNDIQVASASENLANSQLTYGKVNTTITAVSIGEDSNLPVNREFTFKDTSSSVAMARNDQPLTGGTSREASVVTRADQEALVQILSEELTEKAKSELASGITLGDTLIGETVKTVVSQKKFTQELNAEAAELSGSVTVNATGVSYVTSDVISFLKNIVNTKVPAGYQIREEQTSTDVGEIKIAKNGKISTMASIVSVATPQIDINSIQSNAAGKSLSDLQELLKGMNGVGSMALTFRHSPIKDMLPANRANISVTVDVQK